MLRELLSAFRKVHSGPDQVVLVALSEPPGHLAPCLCSGVRQFLAAVYHSYGTESSQSRLLGYGRIQSFLTLVLLCSWDGGAFSIDSSHSGTSSAGFISREVAFCSLCIMYCCQGVDEEIPFILLHRSLWKRLKLKRENCDLFSYLKKY